MNRTSPQTISRAMNTLASWCQNSGIKVLERNAEHLVVGDAEGTERRVTLAVDGGEPGPYTVDIKRLTSRKLSVGLAAFSELQVALGFQPQSPVSRGPVMDRKLSNGEDFELAAFRHTEFRRVPNPAPEKLASYQWLINQASKEFFSRQQWRCQNHMLEIDDLKSYATVWTTNFIGLYERANLTQTENDKLLHVYLIQRFNEFRTILMKKERSVLADLDSAHIALHGRPYDQRDLRGIGHGRRSDPSGGVGGGVGAVGSWDTAPEVEEEADFGEDLYDDAKRALAEGAAQRAAGSAQELSERLAAMGHDQMVETLTAVIENGHIHPDARREAEKRLERHREECPACAALVSAA
jgi:hypothetical protein